MFEIEKHMKLVAQTALVLNNDGKGDLYRLLSGKDGFAGRTGLELLAMGTRNADLPYSPGYIWHTKHFHHPWSHRGYLSKQSSADETVRIYARAKNLWQNDNKAGAMYHLGRALHLIQDINIPHHASVTALWGHGDFEKWLTDNGEPHLVHDGGYYEWEETFTSEDGDSHLVHSGNTYDWIDYGSHLSYPWFQQYFADCIKTEERYHEAAALVIPSVLRLSAGFICKFLREVL